MRPVPAPGTKIAQGYLAVRHGEPIEIPDAPVTQLPDGYAMRWKPSQQDIAALLRGAFIEVAILNGSGTIYPMSVYAVDPLEPCPHRTP